MMDAIGTAFTEVISWVGEFATSLITAEGALNGLLPVFVIGIGVSGVLLGTKIVRSLTWGA